MRPALVVGSSFGLRRTARSRGAAWPGDLGLVLHARAQRFRDLARFGENLLGLPAGLSEQCTVLLEQVSGLAARLVSLLERSPDPLAPLVDRLLDRAEGVLPQDEEGDEEADKRPDHQTRSDLDEGVRRK